MAKRASQDIKNKKSRSRKTSKRTAANLAHKKAIPARYRKDKPKNKKK